MTAQVAMIDVSANNHLSDEPINWTEVKGGKYGAVMIKATEGLDYVNPWLRQDAEGAKAAGLKVGFYHFARPGQSAAAPQAGKAIGVCNGLQHDLGLALDLEVQEGESWEELALWAQDFHAAVRGHFVHSPLYVNDDFLANLPGAPWGERLWLAQTARPRRVVWAWQMTTPANVPGIKVPTDVGWLRPTV